MSLDSLLNCTVTRTAPTQGSENEYGEYVITYTGSTSFNACIQLNKGSEEVQIGGKAIIAEYILYCKPSITIIEGDKVVYKNIGYRAILVDDECQREHHLKVFLKRIP
ncbi:MAG: hypothetical protein ACFFAU_01305 [Candidatus Hodarchaeota archaeon]